MAGLMLPPARNLPQPDEDDAAGAAIAAPPPAAGVKKPPPQGQRKGWVPRSQADFGDGGAFPEVHVAQYPLGMGTKEEARSSSTAVVALEVGEDGAVKYDAIVKQGDGVTLESAQGRGLCFLNHA